MKHRLESFDRSVFVLVIVGETCWDASGPRLCCLTMCRDKMVNVKFNRNAVPLVDTVDVVIAYKDIEIPVQHYVGDWEVWPKGMKTAEAKAGRANADTGIRFSGLDRNVEAEAIDECLRLLQASTKLPDVPKTTLVEVLFPSPGELYNVNDDLAATIAAALLPTPDGRHVNSQDTKHYNPGTTPFWDKRRLRVEHYDGCRDVIGTKSDLAHEMRRIIVQGSDIFGKVEGFDDWYGNFQHQIKMVNESCKLGTPLISTLFLVVGHPLLLFDQIGCFSDGFVKLDELIRKDYGKDVLVLDQWESVHRKYRLEEREMNASWRNRCLQLLQEEFKEIGDLSSERKNEHVRSIMPAYMAKRKNDFFMEKWSDIVEQNRFNSGVPEGIGNCEVLLFGLCRNDSAGLAKLVGSIHDPK